MYEIVSQIIGRLGFVMAELKKRGKIVIPFMSMATRRPVMAAGNAGYALEFASVHVEAGIRTLTPDYVAGEYSMQNAEFSIRKWHAFLQDRAHWLLRFPSRIRAVLYAFSRVCDRRALSTCRTGPRILQSEGYADDRIFVVGNSVADATLEAIDHAKSSTIFDRYPALKDGDFVRFCIHRRENCSSEKTLPRDF